MEVGVADRPGDRSAADAGRSCPGARRPRTASCPARGSRCPRTGAGRRASRRRPRRRRPAWSPGSAGTSASRPAGSSPTTQATSARLVTTTLSRIAGVMPRCGKRRSNRKTRRRADQQHQHGVAVEPVAEPSQARRALVFLDGHRVDLADAAVLEVSRVGVVDGVLALPPAVGGEQQVAEEMAPEAVGPPRLEQRVVGEVVEQRVHAGQENGRGQAEDDRAAARSVRSSARERPDREVGHDDTRDLAEAAPAVDRQVRREIPLPG